MGGDSGFWNSTGSDPWNVDSALALINGLWRENPGDVPFPIVPGAAQYFGNIFHDPLPGEGVLDFGLLRSTTWAYGKGYVDVDTDDPEEGGIRFIKSPFYRASEAVSAWYDDGGAPSVPLLQRVLMGNSYPTWGNPTWYTYSPGNTIVPALYADLLNEKTVEYLSSFDTYEDFLGLFTLPSSDMGWAKIYAAIGGPALDIETILAGTVTQPATFTPAIPVITDPALVTVEAAIAAAIAAYDVDRQAKCDEEEGILGQTLLGTRSMISGAADVAIVSLRNARDRDIQQYTAQLNIDRVNKNADLSVEYQRQLIDVRRFNGDFVVRAGDQTLQDHDQRLRGSIAQVQADLDAARSNEQAKTDHLRARVDLARSMFDAVGAWERNRAIILTNAGPMADMIKAGMMTDMGESQFQREYFLKHEEGRFMNAIRISGAYAADAELRDRAVKYNMMTIREAMAAQGVAYAGSERNPSKFENLMQGLGLAFSGAGSVANIIAAL